MYRKFGGRRGGWPKSPPKAMPSPAPPLGDLIETVTRESLPVDGIDSIDQLKISDVRAIASYNWINEPNPKVIIPGETPRLH